ncbi:MAG TPA: hypothetical protein VKX17_14190 [Planctomycetota bacterium]|nr:hypothetical protein [Planctomycetota bacterium]
MARKKLPRAEAAEREKRRKREWARVHQHTKRPRIRDEPLPIEQTIDAIYAQQARLLKTKSMAGEKLKGHELKFLKRYAKRKLEKKSRMSEIAP